MQVYKGFYKLQEEMGELNQAMGKIGAFENGKYWDGSDLMKPLQDELVDVMAALIYFVKTNNIEFDEARLKHKLAKYEEWGLTPLIKE